MRGIKIKCQYQKKIAEKERHVGVKNWCENNNQLVLRGIKIKCQYEKKIADKGEMYWY